MTQLRERNYGNGPRIRAVCHSPIKLVGLLTILLAILPLTAAATNLSDNSFIPIELSPKSTPDVAPVSAPVPQVAAPAPAPAPVPQGDIHIVQSGDTLYDIAQLYKTDLRKLTSSNSIDTRQKIRPGDRLLVASNVKGVLHRISPGESLSTISKSYNVSTQKIQTVNRLTNPNELHSGQTIFIPGAVRLVQKFGIQWPLAGFGRKNISSGYGYRQHPMGGWQNFHTGIDIAAKTGTSILAAESGKVVQARRQGNYGNCIVIEHQDGISTLYAHASRMDVSVGQYVMRGQRIGAVGSTGRSTGPHLHFEVRRQGKPTSPLSYLP